MQAAPEPGVRVVRCGIDDLPRSVVGARDDREEPFFGLPMLKPRVRPIPEQALADMALDPDPPPGPTVDIARLPPTALPGHSLSPATLDALVAVDPRYDICAGLMKAGETGTFSHRATFSTTGVSSLVVSEADPSPFARCLMERTCQLRVPAGPVSALVSLRAVRTEPTPPPPPPPAPPPPTTDIRVSFVPADGESKRGLVMRFALQCNATTRPQRPVSVRLRVTQRPVPTMAPRGHGGAGRGPRSRPETLDFVPGFSTVAQVLSATKTAFGTCLQDALRSQTREMGRPFVVTIALD